MSNAFDLESLKEKKAGLEAQMESAKQQFHQVVGALAMVSQLIDEIENPKDDEETEGESEEVTEGEE